jgi:hypothetical protein
MAAGDERERQRFDHLVLGRPRPSAARTRKLRKRPVALAPGIEERVLLRERWSHKAEGTAETHEHVAAAQRRPGSLARLHASGAIDDDQLAAAEGILDAWRGVVAGVAVRTASLEARVDGGGHGRAEGEMLGRVHADLAYGRWRQAIGGDAAAVLDVVVHDQGLTIVARRYRMSMGRARRMLAAALDAWWRARGAVRGVRLRCI